MSDIQRYAPWPQEWPQEDPDGDLVEYEDHKKIVDALQARAERLEAALEDADDAIARNTYEWSESWRMETLKNIRAALKGADHE